MFNLFLVVNIFNIYMFNTLLNKSTNLKNIFHLARILQNGQIYSMIESTKFFFAK